MSLLVAFVLLLNPSNYLKNNHPPSLSSRCILTFEVLFSIKSAKGPFKRVNEVDVIFTSYHHTLSEDKDRSASQGWYAVVAVDYWERRSPISETISLAE